MGEAAMPRFVEIAGCPCPAELAPFVREVMRRTGSAPVTIYRGSEPDALAILHAHGKHSQAELVALAAAGRGAEAGIKGTPNPAGQSTHELCSDGRAFPSPVGSKLDPMQCGMDWPDADVPRVIKAFEQLGCKPFRPYGASTNESQHICCRAEGGRLSVLARLRSDPISPGDRSELVRTVQVYLVRAGLLPQDFDVAERVGTYGPKMVAAVREFQRRHRLDDDGVVGPKTFAALRRRFGRRGSVMRARAAARRGAEAPDGDGAPVARAARGARETAARATRAASADGRPGKMRIGPTGMELIKRFEGFRESPYDDGTGVITIGYGETRKPLPRRLTESQAARLLAKRLDRDYEPAVRAVFTGPDALPFNQHRYDALVSFVYNLGPNALKGGAGFETIGKAIRARDLRAIARAMPLYSNPGTNVHEGLLRRRKAEAALFRKRVAG
jgi:GH24 family phage-related lysozyme (muramidase)